MSAAPPDSASGPRRFRVVAPEEGSTLDRLIARRLPEVGLERARDLILAGGVYVGGVRVRIPGTRLASGQRVTVHLVAAVTTALDPTSLVFVHRDPSFVVLDKPAGVPVTATRASARGTLSEALRRALRNEGFARPYVGVVHRLDRAASGLILFSIRDVANRSLHRQLSEHAIDRRYRLVVHGTPPPAITCTVPIVETGEGARAGVGGDPRALAAATRFELLASRSGEHGPESLLEARPETGRTHQIRIHAAALGFPIKGDRRHGPHGGPPADRLHLHAYRLGLVHPVDGSALELVGPLPDWARP